LACSYYILGTWYIKGNLNEYINVQSQVTGEILDCINNELSIESKLFVVGDISAHTNKIQGLLLFLFF
jgi:hypothetical protein